MTTIDVDSLPPVQYLIMETLAARARLGEVCWSFPKRLTPALDALQKLGLLWHDSSPAPGVWRAYLTDAGRAACLMDGYESPALVAHQDLLASIWLYIPWQFVTKQLTTEQKELFADAVDAGKDRLNKTDPCYRDDPAGPVERWWRDA